MSSVYYRRHKQSHSKRYDPVYHSSFIPFSFIQKPNLLWERFVARSIIIRVEVFVPTLEKIITTLEKIITTLEKIVASVNRSNSSRDQKKQQSIPLPNPEISDELGFYRVLEHRLARPLLMH